MTRHAESILRGLSGLKDVNKLAFTWAIGKLFSTSKAEYQILMEELAKIHLQDGQDYLEAQKSVHYAYHAVIGQGNIEKVMKFSLDTFRSSYS